MKLGSLDYIPKQLVEDKLMPLLHTILKERSIGRNRMPVFARDSSAFQKIMQQIRLVAPTDMSVLIFGENGTGKEHIAHHLHDKSKRAGKPFVPVDCGSLSKDLAPSAFFGHVKGAFTGADSTKKGYFNEAEGGTLFLDEVGNLALETQQMLLRAIQERRYRPIGDKTDRESTCPHHRRHQRGSGELRASMTAIAKSSRRPKALTKRCSLPCTSWKSPSIRTISCCSTSAKRPYRM